MAMPENKKAFWNYDIGTRLEAGAELFGFEVKSLRAGRGKLEGAYVGIRGGEAFLIGASIPAFQPKNAPKDYDPERARRLLLNRDEIEMIAHEESVNGLTAVPISWYNKGRHIKLSMGLAKGKKKSDKRESLKERDSKREIDRTLKSR